MANSRERLHQTLNHIEPEELVVDMGATSITGINANALNRLRKAVGLEDRKVKISEPLQLLGEVEEDLRQELHLDYDVSSAPEDPVVRAWGIDSKGKEFELLIHVNGVDPRNASPAEMRALEAHLKKQGDSVIASSGMREWRVGEAMWGFDVNEKLDFIQFLNEGAQMAVEPDRAARTRLDAERFLFYFLRNQGRERQE